MNSKVKWDKDSEILQNMLLHNFDFCWEVIIHGSLISVGTFCSALSFKDVCVVNILRRQRQHFSLD